MEKLSDEEEVEENKEDEETIENDGEHRDGRVTVRGECDTAT